MKTMKKRRARREGAQKRFGKRSSATNEHEYSRMSQRAAESDSKGESFFGREQCRRRRIGLGVRVVCEDQAQRKIGDRNLEAQFEAERDAVIRDLIGADSQRAHPRYQKAVWERRGGFHRGGGFLLLSAARVRTRNEIRESRRPPPSPQGGAGIRGCGQL